VRLVAHNVFSESRRQHVLAHLDGLAEHVPDADKTDVLVHADLAPGNILVAGRRVVVLDLAMMQRGSRFHDITRLNLQLDVLRAKPHFRTAVVEQLQTALLDGYEKSLTPERPLFRYLSMLHRVNHLATLSLKKEPLPGRAVSHLVRKLHRTWIERELATPVAGVGASR
jgi:Ser/Thr protein kinase RdoA (MazF antagonist)